MAESVKQMVASATAVTKFMGTEVSVTLVPVAEAKSADAKRWKTELDFSRKLNEVTIVYAKIGKNWYMVGDESVDMLFDVMTSQAQKKGLEALILDIDGLKSFVLDASDVTAS